MKKLFFIAMMAFNSYQLQADTLSKRDTTKKQFLDASQEKPIEQSPVRKIDDKLQQTDFKIFSKKNKTHSINLSGIIYAESGMTMSWPGADDDARRVDDKKRKNEREADEQRSAAAKRDHEKQADDARSRQRDEDSRADA